MPQIPVHPPNPGVKKAFMPTMRYVGYRQTWECLDGEIDLTTCRDKVHNNVIYFNVEPDKLS